MGSSYAKLRLRAHLAWPGTSIANADAISRLSLPETVEVPVPEPVLNLLQHLEEGPVTVTMIKEAKKTDPVLSSVLQYVLKRWPEKNAADELMPFFGHTHCHAKVDVFYGVQESLHCSVLMEELHQIHPGVSRMKSLARKYVW